MAQWVTRIYQLIILWISNLDLAQLRLFQRSYLESLLQLQSVSACDGLGWSKIASFTSLVVGAEYIWLVPAVSQEGKWWLDHMSSSRLTQAYLHASGHRIPREVRKHSFMCNYFLGYYITFAIVPQAQRSCEREIHKKNKYKQA